MPEEPLPVSPVAKQCWTAEDEQHLADKLAPQANPKITPGGGTDGKPDKDTRRISLEAAIESHKRALRDTKAACEADGVQRVSAISELTANLASLKSQLGAE